MQALEERPPYILYEVREVEDRAASMEAGHYKTKDVDFVIICPQGSKDRTERVASEWFEHIEMEVGNGRFPAAWFRAYKDAYKAWKEGREIPENGVPIKTWPVLSPSQVTHLLNLRIRTVEDLANANEEAIVRIGMGSRALQQKARDWLASAENSGKVVQQLEAYRIENEQLKEQNAQLQAAQEDMLARLDALESASQKPQAQKL